MQINISGRYKKLNKEKTHKYIRELLRFSLEKALKIDEKILKETVIDVSIDASLDVGACVGPLDDKPYRSFNLSFRWDLNKDEIKTGCFHEAIHIWQYLRGDLSESADQKSVLWKRKKYPWVQPWSLEYYQAPWEQEAYSMTEYLFWKYEEKKFS